MCVELEWEDGVNENDECIVNNVFDLFYNWVRFIGMFDVFLSKRLL